MNSATVPLSIEEVDCQLAATFRRRLFDLGYFTYYLAFGDGNIRCVDWQRSVAFLPEELQKAVRLLLLGEALDYGEAQDVLSPAIVKLLERWEIVRVSEARVQCLYRLLGFRDIWFLAEIKANPKVYYGDDSIALATFQTQTTGGRSLDVCAGPGIQAMIAARWHAESHSVEINETAARIQQFNLALNGLADRVTIWNMAFEEFADRADPSWRFSHITCNPPLLPTPKGTDYPFVGDGGPDGLNPVRSLVHRYSERLADDGSIQVIGTGLGSRSQLHFAEALFAIASTHGLSVRVHPLSRWDLRRGSLFFEGLVATAAAMDNFSAKETVANAYENLFAEMDATHIFPFFAAFSRGKQSVVVNVSSYSFGGWFL